MTITRNTLAAPVDATFTLTLQAGGSLPDATTYYVRVFATKILTGATIESPWTIEKSATTGGGNNTIKIDWEVVTGASAYFVVITTTAGNYLETALHTVAMYGVGLSPHTYTLTSESQIVGYCWYRPNGIPVIDVDGGSSGTPLTMDEIYTADVAGGWGNVFHEAVTSTVEWANGTKLNNAFIIDAHLRFGANSSTYFKQTSASISLMGGVYCSPTNCNLFQLGNIAAVGRGGRYGCELLIRGGGGVDCYFTALETDFYDSVIHLASGDITGWRRTPFAHYYDHTWSRRYLNIGTAAGTMRVIGCKISGNWWHVTFEGTTVEMKWNTFCGPVQACSGRQIFINMTFLETGDAVGIIGGTTYRDCEWVYGCWGDVSWYDKYPTNPHNHLVDCTFNSQNQIATHGDSDPYGYWYGGPNYVGNNDLLFEHQFDPTFVDTSGNLIAGATVLLTDKNGTVIVNSTTLATGKLACGSTDVIRRRITCPSVISYWPSGYLSDMIASGWYVEDVRNPHTLRVYKYGKTVASVIMNVEVKVTGTIIENANAFITESNEATVLAYTGITVDHNAQTITMTQNHTIQQLYDFCQTKSAIYTVLTTLDGMNFTSAYDLIINGCTLTADGKVINCGVKAFTTPNGGSCTGIVRYSSGSSYVHLTITGMVPGSECAIYNSDTGAQLMNEVATAGGIATETFVHIADTAVSIRVRNSAYISLIQAATVTNMGLSLQMTQAADPDYYMPGG